MTGNNIEEFFQLEKDNYGKVLVLITEPLSETQRLSLFTNLQNETKLTFLEIHSSFLQCFSKELIDIINHNQFLKTIVICDDSLGYEELKIIWESTKDHPSLTEYKILSRKISIPIELEDSVDSSYEDMYIPSSPYHLNSDSHLHIAEGINYFDIVIQD